MDNNQDTFNNNPQTNILNQNNLNNQQNQPQNNMSNGIQTDNQQPINPLGAINNNPMNNQVNNLEDINPMMNLQSNKFINDNIETNDTSLNNLNIDGEYHNMPKIDYSQDPNVKANLEQFENKKNTITVGPEAKIFLIIVIVLFLFIIVMPYIFDAIREISQ